MICYHLSTDYLHEQDTELGSLLSFQYMKVYAAGTHALVDFLPVSFGQLSMEEKS